MILMLEIVLGSIITGAFIFGAILLLIYLLRWLLYDTTGVERKPRAEKPLDKDEHFESLDIISSGNEHPRRKDPEVQSNPMSDNIASCDMEGFRSTPKPNFNELADGVGEILGEGSTAAPRPSPYCGAAMPLPSGQTMPYSGLPMPYSGLPMPYSGLPMPYSGLPMPYSGLPMPYYGLPMPPPCAPPKPKYNAVEDFDIGNNTSNDSDY